MISDCSLKIKTDNQIQSLWRTRKTLVWERHCILDSTILGMSTQKYVLISFMELTPRGMCIGVLPVLVEEKALPEVKVSQHNKV